MLKDTVFAKALSKLFFFFFPCLCITGAEGWVSVLTPHSHFKIFSSPLPQKSYFKRLLSGYITWYSSLLPWSAVPLVTLFKILSFSSFYINSHSYWFQHPSSIIHNYPTPSPLSLISLVTLFCLTLSTFSHDRTVNLVITDDSTLSKSGPRRSIPWPPPPFVWASLFQCAHSIILYSFEYF